MRIHTSFILIKVRCIECATCGKLFVKFRLSNKFNACMLDDMMNDAAQYFARYIHDTWYRHLMMQEQSISSPTNIVLVSSRNIDIIGIIDYCLQASDFFLLQIFISTSDKICYISSGTRIAAILPWWRLEHVVQSMKPDLRKGQTGKALGIAVDDLTQLLRQGPPSFLDRLDDFVERFGVVIAFTVFTFVFATWGECRDRRKRFFSAERMSRMNSAEREKARQLQRSFQTKSVSASGCDFDVYINSVFD